MRLLLYLVTLAASAPMFTADSVTIFSFSLNFYRWMVTCPLLLGVYKPLVLEDHITSLTVSTSNCQSLPVSSGHITLLTITTSNYQSLPVSIGHITSLTVSISRCKSLQVSSGHISLHQSQVVISYLSPSPLVTVSLY